MLAYREHIYNKYHITVHGGASHHHVFFITTFTSKLLYNEYILHKE